MVVTGDADLEQRCQSLINCGRRRPGDTFEGPLMGANYRMTEWQCAVLIAQLERMPEHIERKRAMGERLRAGLEKIKGVVTLKPEPRVTRQVIYTFLFKVDAAALDVSRNRFIRALLSEGIPCGVGNEPVYRSPLFPLEAPAYRAACEAAGARPGAEAPCPVAERLFEKELVAIPHQCLLGGERDVDDIIEAAGKVAANAKELADAKLERAA